MEKFITNFSKDKTEIYKEAIEIYKLIDPLLEFTIKEMATDVFENILPNLSAMYTSHYVDLSIFWSIYNKIERNGVYANETGKTPRQLAEINKELLEALTLCVQYGEEFGMNNQTYLKAQQAIKKATK